MPPSGSTPTTPARPKAEANTYSLPRGEALRRELVKAFRAQRNAVLKFARTGRKSAAGLAVKQEPTGLPFAVPSWHDFGLGALDLAGRMTPLLTMTWDAAGAKFAPRVGLDPNQWSVVDPHTERMIKDAALAFSDSMNATTSLQLDEALKRTREELTAGVVVTGESLPKLTKRINAIFDKAETWRARRIAQTETSRAVHAAQEQTAIKSGVVTGWQWLLSEDACPLCQTVARRAPAVRLGHAFAVVGDDPHYSTVKFPPLHPHCNCTCVEVLDVDDQPAWADTLHQPVPEPADEPAEPKPAPRPQPKPRGSGKPKPAPVPEPTPEPIPARKPKRPPPPKAPRKPTRPVRPQGTPVGDALKLDPKLPAAVAGNVQDAVKAIGDVHGDGVLNKIPIKQYKGVYGVMGEFHRSDGVATKITISPAGDYQRLTAAHEIGHFVEHAGIPKSYQSDWGGEPIAVDQKRKRTWSNDPLTKPLLDAMQASKAHERNSTIAGQTRISLRSGDDVRSYDVDKKYGEYLNSPVECFARAYAQYVALRSESPEMRADLDKARKSDPVWAQQWADDDFEPIAREFDALFLKLGWRK